MLLFVPQSVAVGNEGRGAAAPHTGTQPFNIPAQDPGAPLRVCGCGRQHRAHQPTDRCLDCQYAEHIER
ncbi:hypothetical protein [Streptomyces virginiae]|uniref:hypothetical protein n=1 Tax=Streptomyces virginiae TaxID=1961 RepID=UPI002F90D6EE|nr:hypothetical protein OG253_41190 [Streptomyces virginiae]